MKVTPEITVGVLGGGQLCRMMAIEAKKMGLRIGSLDPNPTGSAGQLTDFQVQGQWSDLEASLKLAKQCDVLTLDTEHVPAENLEKLQEIAPVRPSPNVLRIVQDRLIQRQYLKKEGLPQTPFAPLSTSDELKDMVSKLGDKGILKTRHSGYDGKGQAKFNEEKTLSQAWSDIGQRPCVGETFIDFTKEISLILARDVKGNIKTYPVAENLHVNQVLRKTRVPARVTEEVSDEAIRIGSHLANSLDYVGILAIEFFLTKKDELLINEIAPRPHNSGHFTFGGCATSQFEQHIRAISGFSLGETRLFGPTIMLNLFGDMWQNSSIDWKEILQDPRVHLHLYGKGEAREGRKMGHLLILSESIESAERVAKSLEKRIYS